MIHSNQPESLPEGCVVHTFESHADSRGVFLEIFRDEWDVGLSPCQWNLVRSKANVLRGVHVHRRHRDFLMVVDGEMTLGLSDLRSNSTTQGVSATLTLRPDQPRAVVIPPGVAHGFYFHAPSIHLYAVDCYWDTDDELGCRWDDPDLGLEWPAEKPSLSERDENLPSLSALRAQLAEHQAL